MWTRVQLKTNAKQLFYRDYWCYVAVTLLMGFFASTGSFSGVSTANEVNFSGQYGNTTHTWSYNSPSYWMSGAERSLLTIIVVVLLLIALAVTLLHIFVGNVLVVGGNTFFIKSRDGKQPIKTMLEPFRSGSYKNVVLTMFLMNLYIFLWSLLLIVPGVIKSYEYLMVPYILAENPGMNRQDAFAISKRMMDGQKWAAFVLELSFIGWALLSVLTCGILSIFYVNPYRAATFAELYAYNKVKAYNEGYIR